MIIGLISQMIFTFI